MSVHVDTFIYNAGSTFDEVFVWPDENGEPADLTGWTVTAIDKEGVIGLVVSVVNASDGEIRMTIPASATLEMPRGRSSYFRIQATNNGTSTATSKMWIDLA